MEIQPLYNPKTIPILGRFSYPTPAALRPGQWPGIRNLRWDDGVFRVRNGLGSWGPAAPSGYTSSWVFAGGTIVPYGAGYVLIEGWLDAGTPAKVRIYLNVWSGSAWGGWAEVTESAGRYGNTRLSQLPTYGYLSFLAIPDADGTRAVVVQNGVDYPLIVSLVSVGEKAVPVRELAAPEAARQHSVVAEAAGSLDLFGTWDGANSGGGITEAQAVGKEVTFTAGTVAANDWSKWVIANKTLDLSNSKQVFLAVRYSSYTWLASCKIELLAGTEPDSPSDNTSVVAVVHDPANATAPVNSMVETEFTAEDAGGYVLLAFPLSDDQRAGCSAVTGLKITATRANVPSGATLTIYALMGGGLVPGTAQYAVSWKNASSGAESASVVLKAPSIAQHDAAKSALPAGATLPMDARLFYRYRVPVLAPSSTDGARGQIAWYVYRQDPGAAKFYRANLMTVSDYDATTDNRWECSPTYFAAYDDWGARGTVSDYSDTVEPYLLDRTEEAPSEFNEPMPVGYAMAYANNRVFVGVSRGSGSASKFNGIKISDRDNPYRFRTIPDDQTPLDLALTGGLASVGAEDVTAILAASSSLVGVSNVYAWTNRGLYLLDGYAVRRIASAGTISPHSVTEWDGVVFWLDTDMQVRQLAGGADEISRGAIDDALSAIPDARKPYATGAFSRSRYLCAHSASGQTENRTVQVWNQVMGAWESEDTYPATTHPALYFPLRIGTAQKLLCFGTDGLLYEVEKSGQAGDLSASANIAAQLKSRLMCADDFSSSVVVGAVGMVADDAAGVSATCTRTVWTSIYGDPTSVAGSMSMDSGGAYLNRWDMHASEARMVGALGVAIQVQVDFTAPAGTRMYSLFTEVAPGGKQTDA